MTGTPSVPISRSMLTDKPNIVISKPPKRTRRKSVAAALIDGPSIVFAQPPSQIRRKAAALASTVADAKTGTVTAEEHEAPARGG
jgi:hypothetical protein